MYPAVLEANAHVAFLPPHAEVRSAITIRILLLRYSYLCQPSSSSEQQYQSQLYQWWRHQRRYE